MSAMIVGRDAGARAEAGETKDNPYPAGLIRQGDPRERFAAFPDGSGLVAQSAIA
jgi:hypothetical protein